MTTLYILTSDKLSRSADHNLTVTNVENFAKVYAELQKSYAIVRVIMGSQLSEGDISALLSCLRK